jgi:hypothetical protein
LLYKTGCSGESCGPGGERLEQLKGLGEKIHQYRPREIVTGEAAFM